MEQKGKETVLAGSDSERPIGAIYAFRNVETVWREFRRNVDSTESHCHGGKTADEGLGTAEMAIVAVGIIAVGN